MATNLTERWLDFAQTVLEQTSHVKPNPEDPDYAKTRADVVWATVTELRKGYFAFKAATAPSRAKRGQ